MSKYETSIEPLEPQKNNGHIARYSYWEGSKLTTIDIGVQKISCYLPNGQIITTDLNDEPGFLIKSPDKQIQIDLSHFIDKPFDQNTALEIGDQIIREIKGDS